MKCSKIVVLFFSLLMLSCAGQPHQQPYSAVGMKKIAGEIFHPEVELLSPGPVFLLDDKVLVVDKYDGKIMTEISLDDNSVARLLNVGNGPHEFIYISGIYDIRPTGEFCVFDRGKRTFSRYLSKKGFECSPDTYVGSADFSSSEILYSVIPFRGGYVASGCFGSGIFAELSSDMSSVSCFGQYPGDNTGAGTQEFCLKNQMTICTDPNHGYFAAAGVYNDWLAFYRHEGTGFVLEKEYFSMDADLNTVGFSDGKTTYYACEETPNTVRTYKSLYASGDYFYALYWGVKSSEMSAEGNVSRVLKFSLDGEYIGGYIIDGLLKSFAVTGDNTTLFAIISLDDCDFLMKYIIK